MSGVVINETARIAAAFRARESRREHSLFRDPFAMRLAGQGHGPADQSESESDDGLGIVIRTAVFDEIILSTIKNASLDSVLNLASGLDSRPWRLPLPSDINWIDIDLPSMTKYKEGLMSGIRPNCQYQFYSADLTRPYARQSILRRLSSRLCRALIISEGFLSYLPSDSVHSIACDLYSHAFCRYWLLDVAGMRMLKALNRVLRSSNAVCNGSIKFRFAPADRIDFFSSTGWREVEYRGFVTEARRLGRETPWMIMYRVLGEIVPDLSSIALDDESGFALYTRAEDVKSPPSKQPIIA